MITPWILGSGHAGQAAAKSLACLALQRPYLDLAPVRWLTRGDSLERLTQESERPLLVIANPHGLHAQTLTDAVHSGVRHIVVEKPACVNLAELHRLRELTTTIPDLKVAVLHVYRMMWGPQTIKQMLQSGELGELITIEGRYWQASTAERAVQADTGQSSSSWKDDVALSGAFDVYLDVASHWFDLQSFLAAETPRQIEAWLSYKNAQTPHRDSHLQATTLFSSGRRGFGSVSKTVHGAGNHLEVNVLGTKGAASWKLQEPDTIIFGHGRDSRLISRKTTTLGSQQPPFHGTGWLEGYTEIMHQMALEMQGGQGNHPRLEENLDLLKVMLEATFSK